MEEFDTDISNITTSSTENTTGSSYNKENHYEPIQQFTSGAHGSELKRRTSTHSSKSLERSSSLGDGYTHPRVHYDRFQEEEDAKPEEERPEGIEPEFVVGWDGPNDPENPRNMSYGRKWLIVIILSMGSSCVYGAR